MSLINLRRILVSKMLSKALIELILNNPESIKDMKSN